MSNHTTEIRIQIRGFPYTPPPEGSQGANNFLWLGRAILQQGATYKVGHTGSDGVVTFVAVEPIPSNIAVFLPYVYTCSPTGTYSTRSVIDDGVLSTWPLTGNKKADEWCTADSQAPQQQAQPGEIVIFAHPMNRFVWSWHDTFR